MLKTEKFAKRAEKEAEKLGINNYLMVIVGNETDDITISRSYNKKDAPSKETFDKMDGIYRMITSEFFDLGR